MKGPSIAIIMSKKGPPAEEGSEPEMEESDDADHATAAMDEFIAAVGAKDTSKALEAFDVLCDLHKGDYEEGE